MNKEIIGIEVSGEIYSIKDEKTSGKTQTLESKVQELKTLVDTYEEEIKELGKIIVESVNVAIGTNQYESFYYADTGITKKGQLLSLNVKSTHEANFIVVEIIREGGTYIDIRSFSKVGNTSYTLEIVWLTK